MTRERLPARRRQVTFGIEHHGLEFAVSVGRYGDGRFAEVFVSCSKVATESDLLGRDAATIISIAAQHGVPLSAFRSALCRTEDGKAESFVGVILDAIEDLSPPTGAGYPAVGNSPPIIDSAGAENIDSSPPAIESAEVVQP